MLSPITSLLTRLPSEFFGSWFTRILAQHRMDSAWQTSLRKAGGRCGISSDFADFLSRTRILLRLKINTFRADRPIPSAQDYAVSLAFLLKELRESEEFCPTITTSQIRGLAVFLRQSWLLSIHRSFLLRSHFKEIRDTTPASALQSGSSCLPGFDAILESQGDLDEAYYATFNTPDATHYIHVWLPDAEHIVHYDELRHVIKVAVNAARGCDLGFYHVGCDYSLSDQAYSQRLFAVFEDPEELSECGKYEGELMIGRQIGEPLWLR